MLKKRKKTWIILGILLTLCIGSIGYLKYFYKNDTQNISYNTFIEKVHKEKVKIVYLVDDPKIKGMLKDGTSFITDNPRTEKLKEILLKHDIKVEENQGSLMITNILSFVGFILVFGGMGLFLSRQSSRQTSREFSKMSSMEPTDQEKIQVTFKSVAGNQEAKESMMDLVDFLQRPEKYTQYGARIPRGVILYGPPGTGKTLLAKALAGEAKVPFYAVSGSDFVQIYAGLGAGRIRNLFKKAREKGKCVIFIDEIDALGKKRDGLGGNDETDRTLNALLTEMSGFHDNEGIIVIAATNRLDTLDEALLRPGRFDRQVEVGLPDKNARYSILKLYSQTKPLEESVDLENIAHQTVYFSGAQLESLMNEAAILAAKENAKYITMRHIDKSFYTVLAGEEKKDRSNISEQDRQITAYHEAGHALVTKLIAPLHKVSKVTIIPSTKGAGGFSMNIPPSKMYQTKQDMMNNIKIALGGRVAEEITFGEKQVTTGASNDIEKATSTIVSMIKKFGMSKKIGLLNYHILHNYQGAAMDQDILDETRKVMEALYEETKNLLITHQETLSKIAKDLLDHETLNEKDLDEILSKDVSLKKSYAKIEQ